MANYSVIPRNFCQFWCFSAIRDLSNHPTGQVPVVVPAKNRPIFHGKSSTKYKEWPWKHSLKLKTVINLMWWWERRVFKVLSNRWQSNECEFIWMSLKNAPVTLSECEICAEKKYQIRTMSPWFEKIVSPIDDWRERRGQCPVEYVFPLRQIFI